MSGASREQVATAAAACDAVEVALRATSTPLGYDDALVRLAGVEARIGRLPNAGARGPAELAARLRLLGDAAGAMRAAIRTHLRTHFREDYAVLLEARNVLEDRRAELQDVLPSSARR